MYINVKSQFGEYCTSKAQGKRFADILKVGMSSRGIVDLDFCAVRILSTDFLEEALYQITAKYLPVKILRKIDVLNIKKELREHFLFMLDHSSKYHRDADYKNEIDEHFNKSKVDSQKAKSEAKSNNEKRKPKEVSPKQTSNTEEITVPSIDELVINITPERKT